MTIQAVTSAMQILEDLVDSPDGVSVSELTRELRMNKGSVSRLLSTLEIDGYATQSPSTGRYILTLKLLSLAHRYTDRLGFPAAVQPLMDRLATDVGELVQLAACDGERLYVIAKAEGDAHIRPQSMLGRVIALHASATGKAWLSALPADVAAAIVARQGLPSLTQRTITDLTVLLAELDTVRVQGYATQDEELMEHMSAIGVPVLHHYDGTAVGAIAIAAPSFRFPKDRRLLLLESLRTLAQQIAEVWPNGFSHMRSFQRERPPTVLTGA